MRVLIVYILVTVFSISLIGGLFVRAEEEKVEKSTNVQSEHVVILPDRLNWVDVSSLPPGAKIAILEGDPKMSGPFTMRVKFPAKYKVPVHWHPADEHVTVISGTLNIGLGDRFDRMKVHEVPAGAFTIMPAHTNHFAWIEEETILQLHGTGPWELNYVNPEDDTRKNLN